MVISTMIVDSRRQQWRGTQRRRNYSKPAPNAQSSKRRAARAS